MKNKSRRILSVLLALATIISMLPIAAMAKKHVTGCDYEEDGTCECESIKNQEYWDDIFDALPNDEIEVDVCSEEELYDWANDTWLPKFIRSNKTAFRELEIDTDDDLEVKVKRFNDDEATLNFCYLNQSIGLIFIDVETSSKHKNHDRYEIITDKDDHYRPEGDETVTIEFKWEGVSEDNQPKRVEAVLYKNGKVFDEHVVSKVIDGWKYKWTDLSDKSSIDWTVKIPDVPDGYTCKIARVKEHYFVATMTKKGTESSTPSTSVPSTPSTSKPNGGKVNPETGAF